MVARHTYPEVPPRVEYSLTEKGEALVPLIEDMRRYGREYLGVEDCAVTPTAWASPPAAAPAPGGCAAPPLRQDTRLRRRNRVACAIELSTTRCGTSRWRPPRY